jgi:hypothetical protein
MHKKPKPVHTVFNPTQMSYIDMANTMFITTKLLYVIGPDLIWNLGTNKRIPNDLFDEEERIQYAHLTEDTIYIFDTLTRNMLTLKSDDRCEIIDSIFKLTMLKRAFVVTVIGMLDKTSMLIDAHRVDERGMNVVLCTQSRVPANNTLQFLLWNETPIRTYNNVQIFPCTYDRDISGYLRLRRNFPNIPFVYHNEIEPDHIPRIADIRNTSGMWRIPYYNLNDGAELDGYLCTRCRICMLTPMCDNCGDPLFTKTRIARYRCNEVFALISGHVFSDDEFIDGVSTQDFLCYLYGNIIYHISPDPSVVPAY